MKKMALLLLLIFLVSPSVLAEQSPFLALILDPGHGGENDPGIKSSNGQREKDLAWQFVKDLTEKINQQFPQLRVINTRNEDIAKDQKERSQFANRYRPALYLSFHFTASKDKEVNGSHIYYYFSQQEEKKAANGPENQQLFIAVSKASQKYAEQSRKIGELLCQQLRLSKVSPCQKTIGAAVSPLSGLRMPAVLIELGYLSNSKFADIVSYREEPYYSQLQNAFLRTLKLLLKK